MVRSVVERDDAAEVWGDARTDAASVSLRGAVSVAITALVVFVCDGSCFWCCCCCCCCFRCSFCIFRIASSVTLMLKALDRGRGVNNDEYGR